MKTKVCGRCKKKKFITEFYKNDTRKDKLRNQCKECDKKWYQKNFEKIKKYQQKWYQDNSEKRKKQATKWKQDNFEKQREINKKSCRKWRENNPKKYKEAVRKWQKNNPEKIREKSKRWLSIPKNRLNSNISNAISKSLKGNKKGRHWEDIIGYTLEKLMSHLEKQFKPNMNWNNYGYYGWHIDHIRPQASFNFTFYKDKEFKECWALENLRPLWWKDNLSKGKTISIYKGELFYGFT